jgi:tricorn protease
MNLTHNSGSREKNAAWSPDGRWIAFISDRTGEEEVYLVDQKAEQPWRQLTHGGLGFRMHLVWSPDSKHLIFSDKFMRLNMADAETGEIARLDQGEYDDAWERWGIQDYVWSPDSQWIAYTKMERTMHDSIFLYSLKERKAFRLTSEMTTDWSPSFDPEGRYLYFLSNRTFSPVMCLVDQDHVFLDMTRAYLVLLGADTPSPFAPKDSSEEVKAPEKEGEEGAPAAEAPQAAEKPAGEEKTAATKETKIDLDGIERRILAAENISAAKLFRLEATKKGFMYLLKPENEFSKYQVVTDETGGSLDLYHYDLKDQKAIRVLAGIANYHQSADGKKLVYRAGSSYGVVEVGAKASVGDGKIDLARVRIEVEREQEFVQMFNEAWRIERDWFYDPHLHGVNWSAIGEKYRQFVPFCGTRGDLNYLIGEMIAELNIGHTYVSGGDLESSPRRVSTGMLGAEFVAEPGVRYYRIGRVVPGTPGDPSERSPLDQPGCPVQAGHYLIAIDGQEATTDCDVYKYLQDKANRVVTLRYNDRPDREGAKEYRVKTIGSENSIRYREWVENNRKYVESISNGEIGYLHIPNMGEAGLIEFAKYWYPQYYKRGFVIDERYNGGGFTGDMIIDRLERQIWGMTQPREGKVWRDPERVFAGPLVVIVNEDTGSNGEFFAQAIKIKKLAPIIGMRTWGGAIGIEAHQSLVDGGSVTPPQFGLYGLDGHWLIEGRGVEPDIEVQNMPGDVLRGKDAQLDAAVDNVSMQFKQKPVVLPPVPPFPDKSKK